MRNVTVFGFLLIALSSNARHQFLSLQSALDKKLVSAEVTSLGGFQGFCISMTLKNLSKDSLVVFVEPGRRLKSPDDKHQDLLIVKQEIIVLRGGGQKLFNVKGYCCQASISAPLRSMNYTVNKMADSGLVVLARYLNKFEFGAGAEQQAVWAISDNGPTAAITSGSDSLAAPLRRFVAALKGEKLPWYTLSSVTQVYSNGTIRIFPLFLKGKLEYSTVADCYFTLKIFNEKGLPVCLTKSEWCKAAANGSYDLNLPVKGLAKGKYTVELTSGNKELIKKEFEL